MIFGKNINRYYLKYWYMYLLGIIALVVVDYADSLMPPRIIGDIINALKEGTMTHEFLLEKCGLILLLVAISFVGRFLWRVGFFTVAHRVAEDLRHRMFKNTLTLSQSFYNDNKVGALMSYYINDIDSVRESFGWGTMMVFDTIILIPLVLTEMFKINWIITLILLVPLLLILTLALTMGKAMEDRYKARQDKFEELSDLTQESFSGIRVVKAFVREARELHDFKNKNKENENVNMHYLKLSVLFDNLIELLIWTIFVGIIALGAYFVLVDNDALRIDIGQSTQLVAYFDTLIWPMFAIAEIINIRSMGKASLRRIDDYLSKKSDLIEPENPVKADNLKGKIEFKNLSFKFPDAVDNQYALNDISLKINEGEFIGIIGKTGSSKTTLVNLLLRLYNVERGQIFIDDVDIMDYSIESLRSHIGYVPQDNFLYSKDIESNIAFSSTNKKIDIEKVKEKARIAGVDQDIMEFPNKYETVLGERGVSVSGGQKQRISIARALYKEPDLLILDDSLSAVDTKTESEILNFLKQERKGKTTILIAHRISSIKDADKIIVLDRGGILSGFDSHQNLLDNNEIYRETYNLQKLEEEGGVLSV